MGIGFTLVERNTLEKKYRFYPIVDIPKFSYLNLNTSKDIQVFWEVMLLD
jgi:hypothetical protein